MAAAERSKVSHYTAKSGEAPPPIASGNNPFAKRSKMSNGEENKTSIRTDLSSLPTYRLHYEKPGATVKKSKVKVSLEKEKDKDKGKKASKTVLVWNNEAFPKVNDTPSNPVVQTKPVQSQGQATSVHKAETVNSYAATNPSQKRKKTLSTAVNIPVSRGQSKGLPTNVATEGSGSFCPPTLPSTVRCSIKTVPEESVATSLQCSTKLPESSFSTVREPSKLRVMSPKVNHPHTKGNKEPQQRHDSRVIIPAKVISRVGVKLQKPKPKQQQQQPSPIVGLGEVEVKDGAMMADPIVGQNHSRSKVKHQHKDGEGEVRKIRKSIVGPMAEKFIVSTKQQRPRQNQQQQQQQPKAVAKVKDPIDKGQMEQAKKDLLPISNQNQALRTVPAPLPETVPSKTAQPNPPKPLDEAKGPKVITDEKKDDDKVDPNFFPWGPPPYNPEGLRKSLKSAQYDPIQIFEEPEKPTENLQSPKGQPSLTRKTQQLLKDLRNMSKHKAGIKRHHRLKPQYKPSGFPADPPGEKLVLPPVLEKKVMDKEDVGKPREVEKRKEEPRETVKKKEEVPEAARNVWEMSVQRALGDPNPDHFSTVATRGGNHRHYHPPPALPPATQGKKIEGKKSKPTTSAQKKVKVTFSTQNMEQQQKRRPSGNLAVVGKGMDNPGQAARTISSKKFGPTQSPEVTPEQRKRTTVQYNANDPYIPDGEKRIARQTAAIASRESMIASPRSPVPVTPLKENLTLSPLHIGKPSGFWLSQSISNVTWYPPPIIAQQPVQSVYFSDLDTQITIPSFRYPLRVEEVHFDGLITQSNFLNVLSRLQELKTLEVHLSTLHHLHLDKFSADTIDLPKLKSFEISSKGFVEDDTRTYNMSRIIANTILILNLDYPELSYLGISIPFVPDLERRLMNSIWHCILHHRKTLQTFNIECAFPEYTNLGRAPRPQIDPLVVEMDISGADEVQLVSFHMFYWTKVGSTEFWRRFLKTQTRMEYIQFWCEGPSYYKFPYDVIKKNYHQLQTLSLNVDVRGYPDQHNKVPIDFTVFSRIPYLKTLALKGQLLHHIVPRDVDQPDIVHVHNLPKRMETIKIMNLNVDKGDLKRFMLENPRLRVLYFDNVGTGGDLGVTLDTLVTLLEKPDGIVEKIEIFDSFNRFSLESREVEGVRGGSLSKFNQGYKLIARILLKKESKPSFRAYRTANNDFEIIYEEDEFPEIDNNNPQQQQQGGGGAGQYRTTTRRFTKKAGSISSKSKRNLNVNDPGQAKVPQFTIGSPPGGGGGGGSHRKKGSRRKTARL